MAIRFTVAVRNQRAHALNQFIGGGAILRIYGGTQAANPDTGITDQTLLVELTFDPSEFATLNNGTLTANGMELVALIPAAAGTATWFRVLQSDGTTAVMDGTVSTTGGSGDLQMNSTTITTEEPVTITGFVWTEGNS